MPGGWGLPGRVELRGVRYRIHTDYRDILQILKVFRNERDGDTAAYVALDLFYEGFGEMPQDLHRQAFEEMGRFIDGGGNMGAGKAGPRLIDWEQDAGMIAAEVNRVAGREVRAMPFLHWHTFLGYFSCIGEGTLATVVAIRKKRATGKKLEEWEREFYRENRQRVDLAKGYTEEDQEEKARMLRRLKGGDEDG